MIQTSTQNLLVLHAYGETTESQKQQLAREMATNESLHEELMELVRAKRELNRKLLSPSESSIRIIMEHSNKTEYLQEI
ncbi:MAG: hypothetical protein KIS94_01955 [Chitinophagales bacterium]|nr:hypothetical protein [Chitinophagales bacterium]